jgi:multidrug efflux system membrane fusion protein
MWSAPRLAAFVSLSALIGCSKPPAASPEPPPAPVTVAAAATKTVPLQLRTIGSVKALATVAVRPRVGGELTGVFFTEGQYVTMKQKLFTIDRRPYDAAVKLATANKAKNVALLEGAKVDLKRAEQAKAGGVAAAAEYDAALTAVDSAKAAIEADEAAINAATIQAGYTTILSPIDGRVGELLVTPGNVVDANDINPLVVINQIRPISVAFTLPEHQLPVVLAARDRAKDPLKVEAAVRGGGQPVVGDLTFVDNAADPQTGTVQFKATFGNADDRLWPGLFVDVVLTLGQRERSVVVPTAAVQTGQKGQYVYVVTADKKAELRPVRVAFEIGGEAVIESGLDGGETVVVEGQLRLAPGTKVAPKPARPTTPGPASTPQVSTGEPR